MRKISVIFFNFRGDAIEISTAFEEMQFDKRGPKPKVKYAGMMQYDGDDSAKVPVNPPGIDRTVGEYKAQLASVKPKNLAM